MGIWYDTLTYCLEANQYLVDSWTWLLEEHGNIVVLCLVLLWVIRFKRRSEQAKRWKLFKSPFHNVILSHTFAVGYILCTLYSVVNLQRTMQDLKDSPGFRPFDPGSHSYDPEQHTPMDYELCAQLHNRIVETVWTGATGRPLEELNTVSWWEHYGEDALMGEQFLTPSLKEFFKLARMLPNGLQFFYYVSSLATPQGDLWGDWQTWMTVSENVPRYMLLYYFGYPIGHTMGML